MFWLMFLLLNPLVQDEEKPKEDLFRKAETEWRMEHEKSMKEEDSWLNLVGLYFLKEGANPFGSRQDIRIALPRYSTVDEAGVLTLKDGKISYEMARAQRAVVYQRDKEGDKGQSGASGDLGLNQILAHNHLRIYPIERGERIALRVRDLRAREYLDFEKLKFYRPKKKYNIEATFEPYDPPKTITVMTVISTEIEMIVPGVIKFQVNGKEMELMPTLETEDDEEWLVMFQDQTSGTTTYSGGRFLYLDKPVDGKININFNRAINPPCAYTVYATCPLPPAENWMDVAIEAGERAYHEEDE